MSTGLLKALRGKFLDKGVQMLMGCLSNLPGKTAGAVIKKPQSFRLRLISSLSELENDADKKFLQNLENGATIGYETDLWNPPTSSMAKQNDESMANIGVLKIITKLS